MPEYRATGFISTREANTYDFSATNDQEALEMLLSRDNLAWSGDADLMDCDVPDAILALDRRKNDGSHETVAEQIQLPGQKPYGQPSRDFVWKTAKLSEEGAYSDAIETLQALIEEARALCLGGNRPKRGDSMSAPIDFPSLKRLPAIHHRAVELALQTYREEAGFNGAPTEETLTALLSDLGHLAGDEGISYLALLAYAQAFRLKQANVRKEAGKTGP